MYLPDRQIYRFEEFEVDLSRGVVSFGGEERHLRQQAFQVLVYLLERGDRLVSKDELFDAVWKNTAVTDDVLVQCVKEIRRVLGDDPHRPRFIKTVPKAGYRFIGVIGALGEAHQEIEEITRVEFEYEEESENEQAPARLTGKSRGLLSFATANRYLLAASVLLIASLIAIGYFVWPSNSQTADVRLPQLAGKRAVAVMYFENQSGDTRLDWLREGLADMLITDLSRSKNLTLLSRQQLHLLMERAGNRSDQSLRLDAALDIAHKSRAEVIVLGSFANVGQQVRIDGQLHDAQTGHLLAAEHIVANDHGQILEQVGLLSLKLAAHLGGASPSGAESGLSRVMTDNLEAYRYYSLAVEKAQAMHNEEAILLLEKAVALDPQFAMAHGRIGYAYAVTGPYVEKAKPHLEKAFQLSGRLTEKDRLYIRAWYSIAHQDYATAITELRQITQQYPLEIEPYFRLAYLLRGENQHDEALQVLKQGLAVDALAKDIYNAMGLIYLDIHRHDEAIAAHRRYVELAPGEANSHDSLGMSYQSAGRYDEAVAEYSRALELDPKFGIAGYHLGHTYAQMGRYAIAIEQYRRALDLAPGDRERSVGYGAIAQVYLRKGDIAQASAAAQMEVKNSRYLVWNSMEIAMRHGDKKAAEKFRQQLLVPTPFGHRGQALPQRYVLYHEAYLARADGRADEAIDLFKAAVAHPPLTWTIDSYEDCLAKAYLGMGRTDEAIAEYERILRINPNYPLAHFHLAEAYRAKGLTEQARASYVAFLEVWKNADPDIPEILIARNALSAG